MKLLQTLFVTSFILSTSVWSKAKNVDPIEVDLLMPSSIDRTGGNGSSINCASWQFGVETNNIVNWTAIPDDCILYIKNYMLGSQYGEDIKVVIEQAYLYAITLTVSDNDKDIWVFDIDDTVLCSLPYYIDNDFGLKPNNVSYMEYMEKAKFTALEDPRKLYWELQDLGFKIVFLTGRFESYRNSTVTNLHKAGFDNWHKIIFKENSYKGTSLYYKTRERTKLVEEGYKIRGNIGDQWSDILGNNTGDRTFKLPDPLYYNS